MDEQFTLSDANNLKDFQCPVCLKYFSRKFTLDMHLLIHQGVKPHPCPFCGKCFRQKGTLMRHKALHSANNLFHCSLCDRGFRQKNVFLYHLRHRHSVVTETLDRRKYPTELKDYQSIMDTLPPFVLADSTAIASSEKHLDAMLLGTLGHGICDSSFAEGSFNGGNQMILAQEDRQSDWDDTYQDSVPNNQVNDGISYKCNLCLIFFSGYDKYKQHVEEQHSDVEMLLDSKPILCSSLSESNISICSISPKNNVHVSVSSDDPTSAANNYSNVKPNVVTSSNDMICDEKRKFCIPCQQSFANEEEFESHLKIHVQSILEDPHATSDKGNDDNSFSKPPKSNCNTPKSNSSSSSDFPLQRQSSIPVGLSNKRTHQDTLDKTRINIPTALNLDNEAHSPESNFICINKKIKAKIQSLENRAKNVNRKSKTTSSSSHYGFLDTFYKCKICNERFQKKVAFEYHRQMHINTRAFECEFCKKKFKSKQLLLAHTRLKHMKTFKCDTCSRLFSYHSIFEFHKKNCSQNVNLETGMNSSFSLPLIEIEKILSSDVSGIAGVIPICDKNVSKNSTYKYGIPIVSVEAMRNLSNFSFLNTLEINASIK